MLLRQHSRRLLLILVLSFGLFFRLADLGHKIYWYDETFTSLRAAGYSEAEVVQRFADSSVVSVAELQQYQQASQQKRLTDTWRSLATEDNQHPPLYYTIAHFWGRWFGSSVAMTRLLPACWSLLGFPAIYWLCQELFVETALFRSKLPNWIGVGLFAISPFHIAYAQESRQYSLWAFLTLMATAALLRAMRIQTTTSWMVYTLTAILNLYTFLLAGLVILVHGLYVVLRSKLKFELNWIAYGSAISISAIAFSPWMWILMSNLGQAETVTQWTANQQSPAQLILTWASIIGRIFYDRGETGFDRLIQLSLVALVGYAFWSCRQAPRSIWLLIVLLTIVPVLPLLLADLIQGGIRSTFPRYFIPTLLGIQLAIVYLLSKKLTQLNLAKRKLVARNCWQLITLAVCSAGIISGMANFYKITSDYKTLSQENYAVAQVVNRDPHTLVVSDAETGDLLSLSHLLQPDVALLIRPRCYTCQQPISKELAFSINSPEFIESIYSYQNVFLFHPRNAKVWRQSLQHQSKVRFESVNLKLPASSNNKVLWRIVNKSAI